ncbi:hypothetical protein V6N13_129840 [Hibiscus sabdariffa]
MYCLSEKGESRNNDKGLTVVIGGGNGTGELLELVFGAPCPGREAWLTTTFEIESNPKLPKLGGRDPKSFTIESDLEYFLLHLIIFFSIVTPKF